MSTLRCFFLLNCTVWVALLLLSGCAGFKLAAHGRLEASFREAAVCEADAIGDPDDVLIVERTRFPTYPLTHEERSEIMCRALRAVDFARDVWFIALHWNRNPDDKNDYAVSVYFMPDSEVGRVRKGKYTRLRGLDFIHEDMEGWEFEGDVAAFDRQRVWDYMQVSESDDGFSSKTGKLEAIAMPFVAPENVSDEDTVAIVDFIRDKCRSVDSSSLDIFFNDYNCSNPIIWIQRNGPFARNKDEIMVSTGSLEGPLSGGGDFVRIELTDGECRIVGFGMWNS